MVKIYLVMLFCAGWLLDRLKTVRIWICPVYGCVVTLDLKMSHFSPGFNEHVEDGFSVSVCACLCTAVCVCVPACLMSAPGH